MKRIFSVLVENRSGVLWKVAGLFSRRGYNINSLAVGETDDSHVSMMTILSSGSEQTLEQIEKQVSKLTEVVDLKVLEHGMSVKRELMLVKISARNNERQDVLTIVEIFHGKVVDVTHDSMILELTGNQDKLEAFLDMLGDYDILELARTGVTGLTRGSEDVVIL